MKRKLSAVLFFFLLPFIAQADFDLSSYQTPGPELKQLGEEFFYPPFFKESDKVNLGNLIAEIRFRFEFFSGVKPEPRYANCYRMQKRINRAIERMKDEMSELPFKRVDDDLLFNESSPLHDFLKPMPRKATLRCSYSSIGDITANGSVYCLFHGPSDDTDFYAKNRELFDSARPLVNSFEIVEMLVFFPALLILPVTWYIMKKALEKK